MIPGIGLFELVLLGVIAIVLFGKRLPEVARNVGRSYGELRKGLSELQTSINTELDQAGNDSNDATAETDQFYDDASEPSAPRLVPPAEDD